MGVNEIASAPARTPGGPRTTSELLLERLTRAPEHVAFRVLPAPGATRASLREVTTREFVERAEAAAAHLIRLGLEPGERVLIIGATSYEWALADFACWFAGAVPVPVYPGSSSQQVSTLAALCGARLQLTDGPASEGQVSFATLARAASPTDAERGQVHERRSARRGTDPATIVFTSGTTGEPRPVLITHANLADVTDAIALEYGGFLHERASTVILLPLAHILARGLQLVCLRTGMSITHLDDPARVLETLKRARPTFLVVVPRVLHKVRERLRAVAARVHLSGVLATCERLAVEEAARGQQGGGRPRHRLARAAADATVFALVRRLFGGRVEVLLSGAAALPAELGLFFDGAGLPVIQGYGLTETTAPATGQRLGDLRAGTVGPPIPGTSIRIAPDGEIQVRGPGVCAGYGVDLASVQPVVDADGYFSTGDLGRLESGHLVVTGRKKDLVTTAYGKTVSPFRWEEAMTQIAGLRHALMVGDDRPFLLGVLFVAPEALEPGSRVRWDLERASAAYNEEVSQPERVRSLLFLTDPIDDDPDLVTPTGKLRKPALTARLAERIEAEYARLEAQRRH